MRNFNTYKFHSGFAIVLALVFGMTVCPGNELSRKAADAFAEGDFAAAVREYEAAIGAGAPSAGLYENLATAQIQAGQRTQAVVSLQRAILLKPQRMDGRMALSDLERSLGLPHVPAGWRETIAEKVPLWPLIIFGCGLFWLGAFLVLIFGCRMGRKFRPMVAAGLCLLMGGGLAAAGFLSDPRWTQRDAAVVLDTNGVKLLSAPADQSGAVASLPGGATVRIVRRSGDWLYAQASDGRTGWAPTPSFEAVVPAL